MIYFYTAITIYKIYQKKNSMQKVVCIIRSFMRKWHNLYVTFSRGDNDIQLQGEYNYIAI